MLNLSNVEVANLTMLLSSQRLLFEDEEDVVEYPFPLNLPTLVSSSTISWKFDVTTSTTHVCDDGHLRELARPDLKRLVRFPAM